MSESTVFRQLHYPVRLVSIALTFGLAVNMAVPARGSECDWRMADLAEILETRSADVNEWEARIAGLNQSLAQLSVAVRESSLEGGCGPNLTAEIDRLRSDILNASLSRRDESLPDWITNWREPVFQCLIGIRERLNASLDQAVVDRNTLQIQRLTGISDQLTQLDLELVSVITNGVVASSKHNRMLEEIEIFNEICSMGSF